MTDKTMTLEPCPFCGHTGPFDQWPCEWLDGSGDNAIRCPMCHGAAKATTWNRRHLSQPAERGEAVAWMSPGKERLEFSRPDTVYGSHTIPLYTAPPPAAGVPDGWKLVAVNEHFGDMMYWVERAVTNGHAPDIDESWDAFSWREIPATPSLTIDVAAVAWAWKSDGMTGWALGHVKPTPENTHKFHERNTVVRPLVFGDAK